VTTVRNINEEIIKKYIRVQEESQREDSDGGAFQVNSNRACGCDLNIGRIKNAWQL